MSLGHANLLFDEIEVIEQPFAGRRNPAGRLHRLCQQIADSDQDVFILCQPAQQLIRSLLRTQAMQTGQDLAVLLHLINAEELRTQRWLAAGVLFCQVVFREAGPKMEQASEINFAAYLHVCGLFPEARNREPVCTQNGGVDGPLRYSLLRATLGSSRILRTYVCVEVRYDIEARASASRRE